MRSFNIVRIDSKGRLIIPYHIRELMDIKEGAEFVVISYHSGEIKLMPFQKDKTEEIGLLIADTPGSLAKITNTLASHKIDIVMSQSRVIERGELAEWHAIVDVSSCKDFKKVLNDIAKLDIVKKVQKVE